MPLDDPARSCSLLIPCIVGLFACVACAPGHESVRPDLNLIDVSGDDCTASTFVYDRPPAESTLEDPGIPFINDGCFGDRIFLGIDSTRRELKRAENLSLGEGGAYTDGEYRVLVTRGQTVVRDEVCPPGTACHDSGGWEYYGKYAAQVRIWSKSGSSWTIRGTLVESGPY